MLRLDEDWGCGAKATSSGFGGRDEMLGAETMSLKINIVSCNSGRRELPSRNYRIENTGVTRFGWGAGRMVKMSDIEKSVHLYENKWLRALKSLIMAYPVENKLVV